jgi:fatty acid desaturase
MSVTKPPATDPEPRRSNHAVALWASIAAFFGSLASFTLVDILSPGEWVQLLAALLTACIVAGGVYSHERLADAKRERESEGK